MNAQAVCAPSDAWRDANQAFLVAALADVRAALKRHAAAGSDAAGEEEPSALSHAEAAWPLPGEQPALRVPVSYTHLTLPTKRIV